MVVDGRPFFTLPHCPEGWISQSFIHINISFTIQNVHGIENKRQIGGNILSIYLPILSNPCRGPRHMCIQCFDNV